MEQKGANFSNWSRMRKRREESQSQSQVSAYYFGTCTVDQLYYLRYRMTAVHIINNHCHNPSFFTTYNIVDF